jgi:hypothetical protein
MRIGGQPYNSKKFRKNFPTRAVDNFVRNYPVVQRIDATTAWRECCNAATAEKFAPDISVLWLAIHAIFVTSNGVGQTASPCA